MSTHVEYAKDVALAAISAVNELYILICRGNYCIHPFNIHRKVEVYQRTVVLDTAGPAKLHTLC